MNMRVVARFFLGIGVLSSFNIPTVALSDARISPKYFCETYSDCRQQFEASVAEARQQYSDAKIWNEQLPGWSQDLATNFAYFPSAKPDSKLLIISSAVHGIEGFAGSAVQSMFVQETLPQTLDQGVSVLLIHGINAYGFSKRNRYSENRVDLNRNWFAEDKFPQRIKNENYDRLDYLFNPKYELTFGNWDFDWFLVRRLLPLVRSIGNGTLTQAAGQGTYDHKDGMMYGGNDFEPHRAMIRPVLLKYLSQHSYSMMWDLHTGLGKRQLQLLPNPAFTDEDHQMRLRVFNVPGRVMEQTGGIDFYTSYGDFSDFVCRTAYQLNTTKVCVNMLMEFGSIIPPQWERPRYGATLRNAINQAYTLYVQIRENQRYHYKSRTPEEDAAFLKAYDELFFPKETAWRQMVLDESKLLMPQFISNFSKIAN